MIYIKQQNIKLNKYWSRAVQCAIICTGHIAYLYDEYI